MAMSRSSRFKSNKSPTTQQTIKVNHTAPNPETVTVLTMFSLQWIQTWRSPRSRWKWKRAFHVKSLCVIPPIVGRTLAHARADMSSSKREPVRSTGFARPSIGSFPSMLPRLIISRGVSSQARRRVWKAGVLYYLDV